MEISNYNITIHLLIQIIARTNMEKTEHIFSHFSEESKTLFDMIQKKGPLTKSDLQSVSDMTLSTLNRFMQPLEKSKLIVECGYGESTGGRKPVLYDVSRSGFYVVGIDISRPYTQLVVTNLKMEILYQQQFSMDDSCTPSKTVLLISKMLRNALEQLRIDKSMIIGVGMGTVGPLDREEGIMINPQNFPAPGWINIPIRKMLTESLELPVIIDNGANTAVLAEINFGEGKQFLNIAYFNCSVGIRTGATSGGKIVRTINDAEDAFGHMVIDFVDGEPCSCGNSGCIECYSSIYAMVKKYTTAVTGGNATTITIAPEKIGFIDICMAAEAGEPLAREIIISGASIFGSGLANYINLLNPSLVILSGPLISWSNLFYQVSTDVATDRVYAKEKKQIYFSKGGHFKENAIAVGAATMVVESYLDKMDLQKDYKSSQLSAV